MPVDQPGLFRELQEHYLQLLTTVEATIKTVQNKDDARGAARSDVWERTGATYKVGQTFMRLLLQHYQ